MRRVIEVIEIRGDNGCERGVSIRGVSIRGVTICGVAIGRVDKGCSNMGVSIRGVEVGVAINIVAILCVKGAY